MILSFSEGIDEFAEKIKPINHRLIGFHFLACQRYWPPKPGLQYQPSLKAGAGEGGEGGIRTLGTV
jgi:hypothetical protein